MIESLQTLYFVNDSQVSSDSTKRYRAFSLGKGGIRYSIRCRLHVLQHAGDLKRKEHVCRY